MFELEYCVGFYVDSMHWTRIWLEERLGNDLFPKYVIFESFFKPNSITLAGSELVRSWFEAGSCQIPLH